jgi:ATP-binding protein involved in chromosome partitioning
MAQVIGEAALRDALRSVKYPDVAKDIVTLGLVKRLAADGGKVTVGVELPTPAAPPRAALESEVRAALARLEGVESVAVEFTARVLGRGAGGRADQQRLPGVKNIVAVAAGKGGVGKSTVSTNLALALQRHGASAGILDADIYGPSVPTMLGPPSVASVATPQQKIQPAVHHGLKVMSVGFFVERAGAVVWRGPMVHKLLQQFLEDVEWGELDYLVVDLPPGTGDAQLSLAQLVPISGALLVTTPQEVALIDVEKAAAMLRKVEVPILGVVENMSEYVCPACGHHDHIFDAGGGKRLAAALEIPLFGSLPIDPRIRHGGDAGMPVVKGAPKTELAGRFLELAAKAAWTLAALHLALPRRAAGLVAIS